MNKSVLITLNTVTRQAPAGKFWTHREFTLTPADAAVNMRTATSVDSFVQFNGLPPGAYAFKGVDMAGLEVLAEPVAGEIVIPDGEVQPGAEFQALVGFSYSVA